MVEHSNMLDETLLPAGWFLLHSVATCVNVFLVDLNYYISDVYPRFNFYVFLDHLLTDINDECSHLCLISYISSLSVNL